MWCIVIDMMLVRDERVVINIIDVGRYSFDSIEMRYFE